MVMLANGLAERGHQVDLVLVKAEGRYLSEVSPHVNVIDLNRHRVLTSLWPLTRYLRRERPNAMLSALIHANVVAILSRMLARVETRLIVSERNSLARLRGRSGAVFRFIIRLLYPRADGVIAVSRGIARELEEQTGLPSQQITSIPNPVDVDRIATLAAEPPPHSWLAPGAPAVILAVGRLEPQKDYPTLLSAFARIRAQREVRLIILGEGSLRRELEQSIAEASLEDSIMMPGFQPNPFRWMAASKVYVLSSRHEGLPNSLLQAMACGTRVVSTNCPTGPDEILHGGRLGKLVPVGDVHALADAITEALDNTSWPDARARLEDFKPEAIVSDYERILI